MKRGSDPAAPPEVRGPMCYWHPNRAAEYSVNFGGLDDTVSFACGTCAGTIQHRIDKGILAGATVTKL